MYNFWMYVVFLCFSSFSGVGAWGGSDCFCCCCSLSVPSLFSCICNGSDGLLQQNILNSLSLFLPLPPSFSLSAHSLLLSGNKPETPFLLWWQAVEIHFLTNFVWGHLYVDRLPLMCHCHCVTLTLSLGLVHNGTCTLCAPVASCGPNPHPKP